METRKFTKFEIATIKRTAQNVNPMVSKKAKLKKQIDALQEEYNRLDTMQEQYEASIKTMTGGYGTEDLVERVVETTNAVDKNGNAVKITKYVLKYPDTIIPVVTENMDAISPAEVEESPKCDEREVAAEEPTPVSQAIDDMPFEV